MDPTRSVSSEPGPSSVPRTEQNTTTRPDPVESCTERLTGVGVGVRPSRGNGVTSEMALIVDGGLVALTCGSRAVGPACQWERILLQCCIATVFSWTSRLTNTWVPVLWSLIVGGSESLCRTTKEPLLFFSQGNGIPRIDFNRKIDFFRRWTANSSYSSKLAYLAQLNGSFCSFQGSYI